MTATTSGVAALWLARAYAPTKESVQAQRLLRGEPEGTASEPIPHVWKPHLLQQGIYPTPSGEVLAAPSLPWYMALEPCGFCASILLKLAIDFLKLSERLAIC